MCLFLLLCLGGKKFNAKRLPCERAGGCCLFSSPFFPSRGSTQGSGGWSKTLRTWFDSVVGYSSGVSSGPDCGYTHGGVMIICTEDAQRDESQSGTSVSSLVDKRRMNIVRNANHNQTSLLSSSLLSALCVCVCVSRLLFEPRVPSALRHRRHLSHAMCSCVGYGNGTGIHAALVSPLIEFFLYVSP